MNGISSLTTSLNDTDSHNVLEFAQTILETLGFGVVIIDAETHKVVYTNSKALMMSGLTEEMIIGEVCHNLLCPAQLGQCPISDLHNTIDNSERTLLRTDKSEISIIKTVASVVLNGREYYIESIVDNSAHNDIQQQLTRVNKSLKYEIIKREEIQEQIEHLAYHDNLTGLPNRLLFKEQLSHAIKMACRMAKMLAVMSLDLDGFKMINDTMGHAVGDQLIIEVAQRLTKVMRTSDIIARIGGDEFIILIENVQDSDSMKIVSEKILRCFDQPFKISGREFYITTSIGIAVYPTDGTDPEILIKNADIAMYKAKEKGRNQCVICTPIMKDTVIETMQISNQLYRAIDRDEFELYYQPQININNNEIIGLEALIRWKHPELGLISPGKFIPIAEQTGLIHTIGEWVLRTVCKQNKLWQDAGIAKIPVAVNLSVRQFQDPKIVEIIEGILESTGLEPKYLELEITESIAMFDTAYVIETLSAFRSKGIIIAIDDFGTEYSSLNYLKKLPVDRIKIAMPFIQGIDVSEKDEAITKTIIVLAKSMGLRVIAEGVETENQLNFLSARMCDEVQGYYYYKPMPLNEVERLFK